MLRPKRKAWNGGMSGANTAGVAERSGENTVRSGASTVGNTERSGVNAGVINQQPRPRRHQHSRIFAS